jgi:hypothetical protein
MICKNFARFLLAGNILFPLGACGGGGGGGSSPQVTGSTVKLFEDGAGVALATNVSNNQKLLTLSPEIVDVVSSLNSSSNVDDSVDFSNLTLSGTTATAKIYTGTVTIEGITANLTGYDDNSGEAALLFLEIPLRANAVYATGTPLNGIPSGTYTYNGLHGFGRRAVGVTPEIGGFSMSANFSAGTFSYSGTTTSSTLTGSGAIDAGVGRFTSTTMSLNAPLGSYTASLHGLLHGTNAVAVSGVYHSNDTYPDYAGAFVGAR